MAHDYLAITADDRPDIEDLPHELVERKGIGHPDTMCDAIAERASRYYSRYCVDHFGGIAHHWFDKVVLYGGSADVDYGRGQMTKPYTVLFAGKGAFAVGDDPVPLQDILFQAAADVLRETTTGFDAERHLSIACEIVDHQGAGRQRSRYQPRSADELVSLDDMNRTSNDCNLLHGFAPLSRLETAVRGVEQMINGADFKRANPDTGWDVKVFGSRKGSAFRLIVNMPFLAGHIGDFDQYRRRKKECVESITEYLAGLLGEPPELLVNPTDRNGRPYLTALGSVADTGDVGVVGRGNRLNGLITPMRPMSIEAPAGKNPVDHTGKLYGIAADRLAASVFEAVGRPTEVHIFTSKEAPLDQPDEVNVRVKGWDAGSAEQELIGTIVETAMTSMGDVTRELVYTGITMW